MKAVVLDDFGEPEKMRIGEWETPEPLGHQILVKVKATALNRADTLQRQGKYPPPAGASPILGLEIAGEVVKLGPEASQHQIGDAVCGLVPGGAYAEYAVIHEGMALPLPEGLSFAEAAAIPEVFLTAFQALVWLAKLQRGEKILIHAGASGVGTAAIQLAQEIGAEVMVTASAGKHEICRELGAKQCIDYQSEDFEEKIRHLTQSQGVHVILDFIAAPYFQKNLNCLSQDGRLVMLALLGGVQVENLNLVSILRKRLSILGSTLRSRSLEYQLQLTQDLQSFAWTLFSQKKLLAIIDSVFPWSEVVQAHRRMEANENQGKIVLEIPENNA